MKNRKNNYTIEVTSSKAEIYKIFKGDVFNLFGGTTGNIPEILRAVDSVHQNNYLIKHQYIIDNIESWNKVNLLEFVKSGGIFNKPNVIDESRSVNALKEAQKDDLNKNLKNLKDTLLSKPQTATANKRLEGASNTIGAENKDYSKAMAMGTTRIAPKSINKLGLTSKQQTAKNKLDMLCSLKKSDEEISSAFKRINEKKAGEVKNKLMAGFESHSDKKDVFSHNPSRIMTDLHGTGAEEKEGNPKPIEEEKKSKDEELEKIDLDRMSKRASLKFSHNEDDIANLDTRTLLKKKDSIKNVSALGIRKKISQSKIDEVYGREDNDTQETENK